jgi:hypothetical protein
MTREYRSSRPLLASKLIRWVTVATLAVVGVGGASSHAAESSFSLDFSNAYIWRGIVFNDSGVAQFTLDSGSLNAGSVPIGFNVWGNYDIGDFDGTLAKNNISEIDLTVSAGLPAGFEIGLIAYEFPQSPASTQEFYVSWSRDFVVTPSVSFYWDFGAVDSFYASLDLTYSIAAGESTSIDLSGLMAVAGEDFAKAYGGEKGGFYNYNLSAAVSHQVNDTFGLSGSVGYSGSLDKAVLPEQPLGFYVMGGVAFAF